MQIKLFNEKEEFQVTLNVDEEKYKTLAEIVEFVISYLYAIYMTDESYYFPYGEDRVQLDFGTHGCNWTVLEKVKDDQDFSAQ